MAIRVLLHAAFSAEAGEDTGLISGVGAPGESLSLSFSLLAAAELGDLVVEASTLCDGDHEIPATALDVHVVHVWTQAGLGVYQGAPTRVGELLLKDDRVRLKDRYTRRRRGHWRPYRRPVGYVAPDLRLDGEARTALAPGQRKQMWLSLDIPAAATPGLYRGRITVRRPGAREPEAEAALEIEVLPLRLALPRQQAMLWFKGTLDARRPQHHLMPDVFAAQLRDIRRAGFDSVSLIETDPILLQRAVDIAVGAGFRGRLVLDGAEAPAWEQTDFGPLEPIVYVSDELDAHGPERSDDHDRRLLAARAAGLPSMASLMEARTALRLQDESRCPDVVSLFLPRNLELVERAGIGSDIAPAELRFYWHAHMEKPGLHRLLAGAMLFGSGVAGISPYCYQHRPRSPFSPFNDFDEWEPGFLVGDDRRPFKDHMATYPARSGSIPTVQWKGIAAGLADLRHLSTLQATLDAAARSPSSQLRARADEIASELRARLARLRSAELDIVSPTQREPYTGYDPAEHERLRTWVARASVELTQPPGAAAPGVAEPR